MGRSHRGQKLSRCAGKIARLSLTEKAAIRDWMEAVPNVWAQFGEASPAWPATSPCARPAWETLRTLTKAFYAIGLKEGLPFDGAGNPVATGGFTWKGLVDQFKAIVSSEACIYCDAPLVSPEVDHWLAKKIFPCLSIAPDNLVLACRACNSSKHKGGKPVWTVGTASMPAHKPHVANLEGLLHLSERWMVEFKAQYPRTQGKPRGKLKRGRIVPTAPDLRDQLEEYFREIEDEGDAPHRLMRSLVITSALEPERL